MTPASETPCHKCTSYDFGTSLVPVQRCRFYKQNLDTESAEVGCASFRVKRRFESATERFKRKEHQFRDKGWIK